jgi:hypothetical protein
VTWIAPQIERERTLTVGDERTVLQSWLDRHRKTLLYKCSGLTGEQLKLSSAEPSTLTLLGLVRHMAEVERWWFRINSCGEKIGYLYCGEANPNGDFDDIAGADPEHDLEVFRNEIRVCDEAMRDVPFERTFVHPRRGNEISVRWVYVHMVEEYARHNGHADILRERIDGATGD